MLVEVALPIPLPRTFTYRIAEPLAEGTRVRVTFGGRRLVGWVAGEAAAGRELARIRDVDRVLDEQPSVPGDVLALCRWIADYYLAPLGMVLRSALPAVLSDTARTAAPDRRRRVLRITEELPTLTSREERFARAPGSSRSTRRWSPWAAMRTSRTSPIPSASRRRWCADSWPGESPG
jgi:primosomal protein N'